MGLLSFLSPLSNPVAAVVSGALVLSVIGNVGLTWELTHEVKTATVCKDSVVATTTAATTSKTITESLDAKASTTAGNDTSSAIATDTAKLRDNQSRIGYLPYTPTTTSGTEPAGTETIVPANGLSSTSAPGMSPTDLEAAIATVKADQIICVTNTDKVTGWQNFYQSLQDNRKIVNGNAKP